MADDFEMHSRFETAIRLPAAPYAVWEELSEMTHWRKWTDVFDVADDSPQTSWREGAILRVGPQLAGIRLWADVEIIEADPPYRLTWAGDLFGIPGRHGFVFEPAGDGGCQMTQWEACGGLGGYLALYSGAWWLLRRRFEQFNRDLKRHLQHGNRS